MKYIISIFVFVALSIPSYGQIITTIAGNGTSGSSGDGGAATSAEFGLPYSVAVDSAYNVYMVDYISNTARKISTSGIISRYAGNGISGLSGNGGPATSAELMAPIALTMHDTTLYIVDQYMDVRTVGPSGIINQAPISGYYLNPVAIAVDKSGNMYLADWSVHSYIFKVTPSGTASIIAGNGTYGYSGDGGLATSAQLNMPSGVAVDNNGNVYVSDYGNQRIRKISPSGIITTVAGTGTAGYSGDGGLGTAAEISSPEQLAVDDQNNLYITDANNSRIRKLTPTDTITTVVGNGTLGFSGDGGPATAAEISGPQAISFDLSGNMYIADGGNYRIRMVTYCSVKHITRQPKNDTVTVGLAASFSISDTLGLGTYQWQEDNGSGYTNIVDDSNYSGTNNKNFNIAYTTTTMSGHRYRCIRSAGPCADTSAAAVLTLYNVGIEPIASKSSFSIAPNPASGYIVVTAPDKIENIQILDIVGKTIVSRNCNTAKVTVDVQSMQPGIYFVKINKQHIQKFIKQ